MLVEKYLNGKCILIFNVNFVKVVGCDFYPAYDGPQNSNIFSNYP